MTEPHPTPPGQAAPDLTAEEWDRSDLLARAEGTERDADEYKARMETHERDLTAAHAEIGRLTMLTQQQSQQYTLMREDHERERAAWQARVDECEADARRMSQRIDEYDDADLEGQLNTLRTQADGLAAALETIRRDYGHVCAEYEICTHAACQSSYGAWATADEALQAYRSSQAQRRPASGEGDSNA